MYAQVAIVRRLSWILIAVWLCSCQGVQNDAKTNSEYFCPSVDAAIYVGSIYAGNESLYGRAYPSYPFYPKTIQQVARLPGVQVSFDVSDCSTGEFLCKTFVTLSDDGSKDSFILYMPRILKIPQEYDFNGVHAVTYYGTSSKRFGELVQVVLWQEVGDLVTPMKVTIEKGRGVVYWEGLSVKGDQNNNVPAGLCVLQSRKGLFSELVIQPHVANPDPLR